MLQIPDQAFCQDGEEESLRARQTSYRNVLFPLADKRVPVAQRERGSVSAFADKRVPISIRERGLPRSRKLLGPRLSPKADTDPSSR